MKKVHLFITLFFLLIQGQLFSQAWEFFPYAGLTDFSVSSPAAADEESTDFGLLSYTNPALLAGNEGWELQFRGASDLDSLSILNQWGFFASFASFGFGVVSLRQSDGDYDNYYRALWGIGNHAFSLGIGMGWNSPDGGFWESEKNLVLGLLLRPLPYFSLGFVAVSPFTDSAWELMADVAVRPFGNQYLTLFADYALKNGEEFADGFYSFGLVTEPFRGFKLSARYAPCDDRLSIGLSVSFGIPTTQTQMNMDNISGGNPELTTAYSVTVSRSKPSVIEKAVSRGKNYLLLNLRGKVVYENTSFFSRNLRLLAILNTIEAAQKDSSIAGLVINLSGLSVSRANAWEIRQKLLEFKAAGKKVIVYFDTSFSNLYYIASAADIIIMDPLGNIVLRPAAIGLTFFKNLLDMIGIGFDELRFYTYKSAFESYSRDKFSAASREQIQLFVDDIHAQLISEIASGRYMSVAQLTELFKQSFLYNADEAVANRLVDQTGRWELEAIKKLAGTAENREINLVSSSYLATRWDGKDDTWGESDRIALIYAVGGTAMDFGIRARELKQLLLKLDANPFIKAIVIRVDSGGGDSLASDYVAQTIKNLNKPVVISLGAVAASGGYWISMYGDKILATPYTLTGSIGVIAAWLYDKGLKQKLGLSTDIVTSGPFGDLGFGFRIPFTGIMLPDRPLTADERAIIEKDVRFIYAKFISYAAEARGRTSGEIEEVAQGRIWSGLQARGKHLVDGLGGLSDALRLAQQISGVKSELVVREYSTRARGFFALFNIFAADAVPELLAADNQSAETTGAAYPYGENRLTQVASMLTEYLQVLIAFNGRPLAALDFDIFNLYLDENLVP